MSDKEKTQKGKKKKAKETVGAEEPTLDAPAQDAAPESATAPAAEAAAKPTAASDDTVGVAPAPQASAPQIGIKSQYVKDLSFENPGAPGSLVATAEAPDIQVNVEVQARPLQNDSYEVSLHITASGKNGQTTLFVLDLTYGAVCRVVGVPKESLHVAVPRCLVQWKIRHRHGGEFSYPIFQCHRVGDPWIVIEAKQFLRVVDLIGGLYEARLAPVPGPLGRISEQAEDGYACGSGVVHGGSGVGRDA